MGKCQWKRSQLRRMRGKSEEEEERARTEVQPTDTKSSLPPPPPSRNDATTTATPTVSKEGKGTRTRRRRRPGSTPAAAAADDDDDHPSHHHHHQDTVQGGGDHNNNDNGDDDEPLTVVVTRREPSQEDRVPPPLPTKSPPSTPPLATAAAGAQELSPHLRRNAATATQREAREGEGAFTVWSWDPYAVRMIPAVGDTAHQEEEDPTGAATRVLSIDRYRRIERVTVDSPSPGLPLPQDIVNYLTTEGASHRRWAAVTWEYHQLLRVVHNSIVDLLTKSGMPLTASVSLARILSLTQQLAPAVFADVVTRCMNASFHLLFRDGGTEPYLYAVAYSQEDFKVHPGLPEIMDFHEPRIALVSKDQSLQADCVVARRLTTFKSEVFGFCMAKIGECARNGSKMSLSKNHLEVRAAMPFALCLSRAKLRSLLAVQMSLARSSTETRTTTTTPPNSTKTSPSSDHGHPMDHLKKRTFSRWIREGSSSQPRTDGEDAGSAPPRGFLLRRSPSLGMGTPPSTVVPSPSVTATATQQQRVETSPPFGYGGRLPSLEGSPDVTVATRFTDAYDEGVQQESGRIKKVGPRPPTGAVVTAGQSPSFRNTTSDGGWYLKGGPRAPPPEATAVSPDNYVPRKGGGCGGGEEGSGLQHSTPSLHGGEDDSPTTPYLLG